MPRPEYLPTAVKERLDRPVLPSDTLSEWELRKLEGRGIDRDFVDALMPDIVRVRMRLPNIPVPETPVRNYKPPPKQPV